MSRVRENLKFKIGNILHQESVGRWNGSDTSDESAGIVIKIPKLPKYHTTESVTKVVYEAFETLQSPPYNVLHCEAPSYHATAPQILSISAVPAAFGHEARPPTPTMTHRQPQIPAISKQHPRSVPMKNVAKLITNFQGPSTPYQAVDLLDLEMKTVGSPLLRHCQRHGVVVDMIDDNTGKRVLPETQNLISFFEKQKPESNRPQAVTASNAPIQSEKSKKVKEDNDVDQKFVEGKYDHTNLAFHTTHRPRCPTDTTKPRRRPSPPRHLDAGLRPLVNPNAQSTFLNPPTLPTRAAQSAEFSERKHATILLKHPEPKPRKLSRKKDEPDLRTLNQQSPPSMNSTQDKRRHDPQRPVVAHSRVAEKVSMFERPLPALPSESNTNATVRTLKRRGIHGGLPAAEGSTIPYTEEISNHIDVAIKEKRDLRQVGRLDMDRLVIGQPSQRPKSPQLPVVPHVRRGSMLKAIKKELFPEMDMESTVSVTTKGSLSARKSADIKGTTHATTRTIQEVSSRPSCPAPDTQALRLTSSKIVGRKGTLNQLGGRVVQIRTQFEKKEQTTGMPPSAYYRHQPSIPARSSSLDYRAQTRTATEPPTHHPQTSAQLYMHTNRPINTRRPSTAPARTSLTKPTNPSTHIPTTSTTYTPTTASPNLYSLLHPTSPDKTTVHSNLVTSTRTRLLAAADEVDLGASWARAVDTGCTNEVVRKLDYAWEWKRFVDVDWDERERERGLVRRRRKEVEARIRREKDGGDA